MEELEQIEQELQESTQPWICIYVVSNRCHWCREYAPDWNTLVEDIESKQRPVHMTTLNMSNLTLEEQCRWNFWTNMPGTSTVYIFAREQYNQPSAWICIPFNLGSLRDKLLSLEERPNPPSSCAFTVPPMHLGYSVQQWVDYIQVAYPKLLLCGRPVCTVIALVAMIWSAPPWSRVRTVLLWYGVCMAMMVKAIWDVYLLVQLMKRRTTHNSLRTQDALKRPQLVLHKWAGQKK